MEIVAGAPIASSSAPFSEQPSAISAPGQVSPSRWRVVEREIPRLLPVGVAPEQGLQVRTILAARSISAVFPEIDYIGGVRPDSLRWHPHGLALDVIIPNPGAAEGIALGNEIVAYVLKNADSIRAARCHLARHLLHAQRPEKEQAPATSTTSTSPPPEADIPLAVKSTSAEPTTSRTKTGCVPGDHSTLARSTETTDSRRHTPFNGAPTRTRT